MTPDDEDVFDREAELGALRNHLKHQLYPMIYRLKIALVAEAQKPDFEAWYSALVSDFIHGLESYCIELGETIGKDRLSAAAWSARSLLELLVWIIYCRASRENAWRFHEDALRDVRGLVEAHAKFCNLFGIDDSSYASAMKEIQTAASRDLGIEAIDAKFLNVSDAAKATQSVWNQSFTPLNKALSKFTHPTAALLHGLMPRSEERKDIQACLTMQGFHFASHCVAELAGIVGVVDAIPG